MLASKESQQIRPVVSVLMVAYMHEAFIRQAIEGVLLQRTNFVFELVIGEDAGSDNTRAICEEYQVKHPGIIRLLPAELNLGVMPNFIRVFHACKGEFIAICEGDDFWTDPFKLQKQYDRMVSDEMLSFCFHKVTRKIEEENREDQYPVLEKQMFKLEDVIQREWFVPTSSIFFRKQRLQIPSWLTYIVNGDFALLLNLAQKGHFFFIDEDLATYRIHQNGSHRQFQDLMYRTIMVMQTLSFFNQDTDFIYDQLILIRKMSLMKACNKEYAQIQVNDWISKQPGPLRKMAGNAKRNLQKILGNLK